MTEQEQLAWGSHLPALLACIGATSGPVLELGVGHFSTPALHTICGAMQVGVKQIGGGYVPVFRELVSIEENEEWFRQFVDKYHGQHHRLFLGEYLDLIQHLPEKQWSVAFIDNSPGGEGRSKLFELLLPVSDYVVTHDYHRENEEAIAPLLKDSKYHVTRTYEPPTLVASLTRDIPDSILCL